MQHDLFKYGDDDLPDAIKDSNGDVVLSLCRCCKGAEASLTTECCGTALLAHTLDNVQKGRTDFFRGRWWHTQGTITGGAR